MNRLLAFSSAATNGARRASQRFFPLGSIASASSLAVALLLPAGSASADPRGSAIQCEAVVQSAYWQLRNDGKNGPFPLTRYRDVLAQRAERTAREIEYVRQ